MSSAVQGAVNFVKEMGRADWIAWLPFDDTAYQGPQGYKRDVGEDLVDNIISTPAGGGTALYDTVAQAYQMLQERRATQGDTVRYGLVILSDGKDTNSSKTTLALLEALLSPDEGDPTGIQIHTIGIGEDADDLVLSQIATSAHGKYWKVDESVDVADVYREIAKYY